MNARKGIAWIWMLTTALTATAGTRSDIELLERMFDFSKTAAAHVTPKSSSYIYTRFFIDIKKKNPTLLLVPSVFAIANSGQRKYVGEAYSKMIIDGEGHSETQPLLRVTTVPHRGNTFQILQKYLTPKIYDETVIEDYILSPFNKTNKRFYKYRVTFLLNGTARVNFWPKRNNTQLVTGEADVNYYTGRVLNCSFMGEYDMVRFHLRFVMNDNEENYNLPKESHLEAKFRFIGNKVNAKYVAYYDLPHLLTDSIEKEEDFDKLNLVRPDTLSAAEKQLFNQLFENKRKQDSISAIKSMAKKKNNKLKHFLWDTIGDNVLNRVKTNFGVNNQGYIRLNPILNPLYMGYDHRRGFTYKLDVRTNYIFNDNQEISARFKAGYAFKQKQFYFRLPISFYYNKQHNGYIRFEVVNGNHIRDGSVRKDIESENPDSTQFDYDLLNEFRLTEVRSVIAYDISDRFSFQIGSLFQRREAVNGIDFDRFGREKVYTSFAPLAEVQYRPWGWTGPIFTLDYDRAVKGFLKSNIGYERWEFNAEYIHHINKLQSLQMRFGAGLYTYKDHRAYFLNYENFRENNIPGGWNDDWTGEFELLRSDTYNSSDYYLRTNLTYETPLLVLSRIPFLGHYIEMERIYVSGLDVRNVHPYVEIGYGFTCRLFSIGLFVSNGHGNRVIGATIGLELFRHW